MITIHRYKQNMHEQYAFNDDRELVYYKREVDGTPKAAPPSAMKWYYTSHYETAGPVVNEGGIEVQKPLTTIPVPEEVLKEVALLMGDKVEAVPTTPKLVIANA